MNATNFLIILIAVGSQPLTSAKMDLYLVIGLIVFFLLCCLRVAFFFFKSKMCGGVCSRKELTMRRVNMREQRRTDVFVIEVVEDDTAAGLPTYEEVTSPPAYDVAIQLPPVYLCIDMADDVNASDLRF